LTGPARFAIVPIDDARALWLRRDPMLVQLFGAGGGLARADLNSGAAVGWQPGEDPDALAHRIQDRVAGVNVTIPGEVSRLLKESTAFFSALLLGIGGARPGLRGPSPSHTGAPAGFSRVPGLSGQRGPGAPPPPPPPRASP